MSDWESYLAKPGRRRIDDDLAGYTARRDEAYREVFGSAPYVISLPHVTPPGPLDVLLFDEPAPTDLPIIVLPGSLDAPAPGQSQRGFTTLVTSGMSNLRMAYPAEVPRRFLRVELAMYLSKDAVRKNPDLPHFCSDVLMHYAKQPFLDDTFLVVGMVLPVIALSQGRVSFFGDPGITAFLVAPPPDDWPEADLPSKLELDGDGVNVLCLIPLTEAQERIAHLDLGPLNTVPSFDVFAILANLEPIYQGPANPESGPDRGPIGKLDKQIRLPASGGTKSENPKPPTAPPSEERAAPAAAAAPAARMNPKAATTAKSTKKPTKKPKVKAQSRPKRAEPPPPKKPWWKFWA